jgi:hypothetical protein
LIEWPWFTAEELAALTWTKPSYVRTLASKNKWRRRREGKRVTYAFEDAEQDLAPRSEERRQAIQNQADAEEIARDQELYGDLGLRHAGQ